MWLFKLKLLKLKNSVAWWQWTRFKGPTVAGGQWPPYWTAQLETISIMTQRSTGGAVEQEGENFQQEKLCRGRGKVT